MDTFKISLEAIRDQLPERLQRDAWVTDNDDRGTLVAVYRDYVRGKHDAKLSTEMKNWLRIKDSTDELNANYCAMVVQAMADRLFVERIEADSPAATEWIANVLERNRFDGLQIDVTESTLTDADTYVFVDLDPDTRQVRLTHEAAWDGEQGMLAVYDREGEGLEAMIKVWYESTAGGDEMVRVNYYYPDRIEKFAGTGEQLGRFEVEGEAWPTPWVDTAGQPLGIPIVPFQNPNPNEAYGLSELANVVPLQNALNRTLYSMIMTAELSAFQLRVAKGFNPPGKLTPGSWIIIGDDETDRELLGSMEASTMEQAALVPFIEQSNFIINQISTISRTPIPELMGSSVQSGEALKQREIGLLGKVRRFQVKIGNAWENVIRTALRLSTGFAVPKTPEAETISTRWRPAELRNDTEVVERVLAVRDLVGDRETLRLLARVFDWTPDDIDRILTERRQDTRTTLTDLGVAVEGFTQQDDLIDMAALNQQPPTNGA